MCGRTRIGSHGLVEILRAVKETGSLRGAAEKLGINYRRLWSRVKRAEKLLGKPLIKASKRGSVLTEEAEALLNAYEEMLEKLSAAGLLEGIETSVECGA